MKGAPCAECESGHSCFRTVLDRMVSSWGWAVSDIICKARGDFVKPGGRWNPAAGSLQGLATSTVGRGTRTQPRPPACPSSIPVRGDFNGANVSAPYRPSPVSSARYTCGDHGDPRWVRAGSAVPGIWMLREARNLQFGLTPGAELEIPMFLPHFAHIQLGMKLFSYREL